MNRTISIVGIVVMSVGAALAAKPHNAPHPPAPTPTSSVPAAHQKDGQTTPHGGGHIRRDVKGTVVSVTADSITVATRRGNFTYRIGAQTSTISNPSAPKTLAAGQTVRVSALANGHANSIHIVR